MTTSSATPSIDRTDDALPMETQQEIPRAGEHAVKGDETIVEAHDKPPLRKRLPRGPAATVVPVKVPLLLATQRNTRNRVLDEESTVLAHDKHSRRPRPPRRPPDPS